MRKQMICLCLVLLAAMSLRTGASSGLVEGLLNQLAALMELQEQIYAERDAVCHAVNDFLNQNDYPALIRARLTCSDALARLSNMAPPALTLDDEAIRSLLQRRVEVVLIEDKVQEIQQALSSSFPDLRMLEAFLYRSVYWQNELVDGTSWVSLLEEELSLECEFDCLCANALLLPLKDDAAVVQFWSALPELWPLTGRRAAWINDEAALSVRGADTIEALANAQSTAARYLGLGAHHVSQNAESEPTHAISGMPVALPLPDFWSAAGERALFASDESGANGLPQTLIWRMTDVSREVFLRYASDLEALGMIPYKPLEHTGADGLKVRLAWSDAPVMLTWQADGTALIAYDPAALTFEWLAPGAAEP